MGGDGEGCLGNRVQLPPIPTAWMGRLRPEKQRPLSAQGHTARPRLQLPDKKALSLQGLDSLLSFSTQGRLWASPRPCGDRQLAGCAPLPIHRQGPERERPLPTVTQSGLEPKSLAPGSSELPLTTSFSPF